MRMPRPVALPLRCLGVTRVQKRKQALSTGLLLVPMAGLAIGLVQTTSGLTPVTGAQVSALVLTAVAVFETIGPPIAAMALRLSGDAGRARREAAAAAATATATTAAY